jgi:hypothetical protein
MTVDSAAFETRVFNIFTRLGARNIVRSSIPEITFFMDEVTDGYVAKCAVYCNSELAWISRDTIFKFYQAMQDYMPYAGMKRGYFISTGNFMKDAKNKVIEINDARDDFEIILVNSADLMKYDGYKETTAPKPKINKSEVPKSVMHTNPQPVVPTPAHVPVPIPTHTEPDVTITPEIKPVEPAVQSPQMIVTIPDPVVYVNQPQVIQEPTVTNKESKTKKPIINIPKFPGGFKLLQKRPKAPKAPKIPKAPKEPKQVKEHDGDGKIGFTKEFISGFIADFSEMPMDRQLIVIAVILGIIIALIFVSYHSMQRPLIIENSAIYT